MYSPAARYRDTEVLSASPAQLVVIVFDHMLVNLTRARMALESGDVENRCVALDRARQAVAELLSTLDRDRGGQLADHLAGIYTFLLSELSSIRSMNDLRRIQGAIRIATDLRDAFAAAAVQAGGKAA